MSQVNSDLLPADLGPDHEIRSGCNAGNPRSFISQGENMTEDDPQQADA